MNQANQPGGLRCHDAEACAMGQLPCPTPKACNCAPPATQPARECLQQSAALEALAEVSKEQYARMFGAACDALGQISDHLGIDSDINPGAEPIIEAIDELRAAALQAAPPAQEVRNQEYGSTEYGFQHMGFQLQDGDRRLMSLLVRALGSDHAAINDLDSLFSRASRSAPPAPAALAVPAGQYPPLPEPTAFLLCKGSEVTARAWDADQMRAYVDADRAALAAAPAQAVPESHTKALEAIATCPVADIRMNAAAASMRGIAQRALAAPAQEHATQLAGQGQEPSPIAEVMSKGYNGEVLWKGPTPPVGTLLYAAAPVQTQEDARDALTLADQAWNFDSSAYESTRKANAEMLCKLQDCAQTILSQHARIAELEAQGQPAREPLTPEQAATNAAVLGDPLTRALYLAWAKAEPRHPVTHYPTSYFASFRDMADAARAHGTTKEAQ